MAMHKCETCGTYWDDQRERGCPQGHRTKKAGSNGGSADSALLEELRGLVDQAYYQSDKLARIHFWVKWFGVAWVIGLAGGLVVLGIAIAGS